MTSPYSSLSRAQLTYEYLHTNSTTHEFLFGALAELVDNSRDAEATELHVYTVPNEKFRGGFILGFRDNGCGMDAVEVSQVIQFGRSSKRQAGSDQVGQYGNGLKSGTMRIGKDMILFTKKENTMSCLFLSRTFHEIEDIHEVIVPMPSWYVDTKKAYVNESNSQERHDQEVAIILKYSPFNTIEDLLKEFDSIPTAGGTVVMIYNLKLMDNNSPELDVNKTANDIIMADPHSSEVYDIVENILPERVSFRSYLSVIYCEPRMKIFIQGEKVKTKKIIHTLHKPRSYVYTSNRFKKRSELEAENSEKAAKIAEERAKELTTQAREANSKYNAQTKDGRAAIQLAVNKADQAKFDAEVKKRIAEAKRKSSKEPKTLTFTFGFNILRRRCDGIFIYNCNRLIKMYERVGAQTEGGMKCAGLVAVVDVPYLVLEPTHNKQDFADQKEYKHLLKSMGDHMLQYWKDSKIESTGVTKFWDDFGYSSQWRDDPSDEQKFKMKRLMGVAHHIQCDKCLKWRTLSFTRKMVNYEIPSTWMCQDNTDSNFSSCAKAEQKVSIPVGKLLKDMRNLDDKRAEDVRKLQEKLAAKQSEIAKKQRDNTRNSPPAITSPKSRRRKSPSPPPVVETSRRGRRAKSPTPPPAPKSRKKKSPSPPPVKTRKKNSPSPPPKPKRKAKSPSPPPPKKSSPVKKPTKKAPSPPPPAKRGNKKAPSPPPPTRKGRKAKSPSPEPAKKSTKTPVKVDNKRKAADTTTATPAKKGKEEVVEEEDVVSEIYPLDSKVEAKMHNTWYTGSVVAFKKAGGNPAIRVRIKFDKHTQDKFDKWFYEDDPMLRMYDEKTAKEPVAEEEPTSSTNQVSTTTTEETTENVKGELLEKVTYLLSRCLCYFRAPDFKILKKDILSLTPQQLRDFPLGMFFDDYERNIKKQLQATRESLNARAEESDKRLAEVTAEKNKLEKELKEHKQQQNKTSKTLKDLRQGVNVMLRSILNEDEKLDPSDVSDNVDIYLKTIVDQINDSANNT